MIAGSLLNPNAEDGDGQRWINLSSHQAADVPNNEADFDADSSGSGQSPSLRTVLSSPTSEHSLPLLPDARSARLKITLHEAAEGGRESTIEDILAEWDHPDAKDDGGRTPLQKAAWHGHHACVSYLVDHGADVNYGGGPDGSALEISASHGLVDIVMMLLERGATAKDSALHQAAHNGHIPVVDLLINARANVRYIDSSGYTVLDSAIRSRSLNVLKRVLRAGGIEDINHQGNDNNETPLHVAARDGHEKGVQLLLEAGANPHPPADIDSDFVIHAACLDGSVAIVQSLLSRGVDPNTDGGHQGSPLHVACESGNEAILGVLLEYNADVNLPGGRYGSALIAAIEMHHVAIALRLIKCGAEIYGAEERCEALFHLACGLGDVSIVQVLLRKGVTPSVMVESTGSTPLHAAVRGRLYPLRTIQRPVWDHGHLSVVKILLKYGADMKQMNTDGLTALMSAMEVKSMHDSSHTPTRKCEDGCGTLEQIIELLQYWERKLRRML